MIRDDMKFDVRARPHLLRRNELTPEEIEKYLASLPDEAAEMEKTATEFIATFEERNYRH